MSEQYSTNRRAFLAATGATLGAVTTGTVPTVRAAPQRFIVDAGEVGSTGNVEVIHRLDPVDALVVRGSEEAVQDLGGEYAPDRSVSLDEPTRVRSQQVSATDEPPYDLQWDKQSQEIPEVHEVTRGEGTRVAVIDSGVDPDHPDLERAVDRGRSKNFIESKEDYIDEDGHGTHVSGIIAANDENKQGIVGSAPATDLVALRTLDETGGGSFGDILAAIVYCGEIEADVANLSLGGLLEVQDRNDRELYSSVLNRTTSYVSEQAGTLIVAAAGNDSLNLDTLDIGQEYVAVPAENRGVLAISATGPIGFEWGDEGLEEPPEAPADVYTNYGEFTIDLAAPGGNYDFDAIGADAPWYRDLVLSTVPVGTGAAEYDDYDWKAGTSMATPQVAAAGALVKSVNSGAMPYEIEGTLKGAASVPDEYNKQYYGEGLLDTLGAVQD